MNLWRYLMSNSDSNENINKGIEDFYNFQAPMYCPYCSMPYVEAIPEEYAPLEPCDEEFDDNDLYRNRRRRRHRRRRHRRGFPLWPLIFFYDDWYW